MDGVDVAYLAQNARVNVASLAGARAGAAGAGRHERSRTSRRSAGSRQATTPTCSGTPRRAPSAYRVYWRDAWANDWEHSRLVGNQTRFVLPGLSIDDHVFGVAAVGADGHESLVSAYVERRVQRPDSHVVAVAV